MKSLKTLLVLVAVCAVAVSFGCSKKSTPTAAPVTPTTPTTAAVPTAQQPAVAASTTPMVTGSIGNIDNVAGCLGTGSFKGGKNPPDTSWEYRNGWWYAKAGQHFESLDTFKLRFTPDIWAGSAVAPYPKPGQIEYAGYGHYDEVDSNMTMHMTVVYSALGKHVPITDTLSTIVEGNYGYVMHYTIAGSGYNFNLSYSWNVVFDNVSIASGNHSKHFTYTCDWPYISQTTFAVVQTSLNGEFKLDAAGYGNLGTDYYAGFSATNGTPFVKYYYTPTGNYYTLLAESWGTHHSM
jgi:hypothetical protein